MRYHFSLEGSAKMGLAEVGAIVPTHLKTLPKSDSELIIFPNTVRLFVKR